MAYLSMDRPFIFCIEEVMTAPDATIYPVGLTWEQLFEWYYRIKTWNITASTSSITASSVGDTDSVSANCPAFSYDFSYSSVTASEKDFVCTAQAGDFNETVSDGDTKPGISAGASFTLVLAAIFGDPGGVVKYSGLYYPHLELNVGSSAIATYSGSDPSEDYELIFSFPPGAGTPADISITLNGVSFTLSGTLQTTGSAGSHVSANNDPASYPVTWTPTLWWAYNTSAGDTYDTATGAELLDPFSIQSP